MANIDYLKEKADKYKIFIRFLLNLLLTISLGIAGLIYGIANRHLNIETFWLLSLILLILFIKGVIITLVILKKSSEIDEKILKEK